MPAKFSKAKQFFLVAAGFPALIFYLFWMKPYRTQEQMLLMAGAMLAYCALIVVLAYRWDKPGYFDWAIACYFLVVIALLLAAPESAVAWICRYGATGVYTCLFGAAFLPPLAGKDPFTLHFAKKSTPQETWNNPIFIRINQLMTYVWAAIFAVNTVLSLYPSLTMKIIIPHVLILGFGIPFNRLFPDLYLKRLGLPSRAELRRMAGENK